MRNFLLTIAGFDPTGGAGVLRDVRTFNRFGFLGTAVVTANTSQNTKGVFKVVFTDGDFLIDQVERVLDEIEVKGVKVGIPHRDLCVNERLAVRLGDLGVPVVFDPVLSPTFGRTFIEEVSSILPLIEVSTLITPNFSEFEVIKDYLSGKNYVIKGVERGNFVCDRLFLKGVLKKEVCHERDDRVVRGTGCAFSSALLSLLSAGKKIEDAFRESSLFLREYREKAFPLKGAKQLYSEL